MSEKRGFKTSNEMVAEARIRRLDRRKQLEEQLAKYRKFAGNPSPVDVGASPPNFFRLATLAYRRTLPRSARGIGPVMSSNDVLRWIQDEFPTRAWDHYGRATIAGVDAFVTEPYGEADDFRDWAYELGERLNLRTVIKARGWWAKGTCRIAWLNRPFIQKPRVYQ